MLAVLQCSVVMLNALQFVGWDVKLKTQGVPIGDLFCHVEEVFD